MAQPITWLFELFDKMSGPASAMSKAIGSVEKQLIATDVATGKSVKNLDKLGHQVSAVSVELGKLGGGAGSVNLEKLFSGGFAGAFTLGVSEGIGVLIDGIKTAIGLAVELGKKAIEIGAAFVKSSAERSRLEFGFGALPGGTDALDFLGKISKDAQFDDDAMAKLFRPLVQAGFKGDAFRDAVATALDFAATQSTKAEGATAASALVEIFTSIRTTGQVTGKNLKALEGILSEQQFFEQLGKLLGTTAAEAKARAAKGQVAADTLTSIISGAFADRQGGVLGKSGVASSKLVDTRLEKLANLPGEFAKVLTGTAGFGRFNDFLGRLLTTFSPDGPVGQRIIASIQRIFDRLLSLFGEVGSDGTLDKLAIGVISIVEGIEKAIPFVVLFVKSVAVGVGWVFDLWDAFKGFINFFAELPEAFTAFGKGIVDGLTSGITAGYETVTEAVSGLGARVKAAFAETLGIKSPSRVFEEFGAASAEGFTLGLERNAPDPGASFIPQGGGGGGRSVAVHVGEIVIQLGAPPPGETSEQTIERLRPGLRQVVIEVFEEAAEQQGA